MNEDQTSPLEPAETLAAKADLRAQANNPEPITVSGAEAAPTSSESENEPSAGPEADSPEAKLQAALADNQKLTQEISDLKDQTLRMRADFENTRKRLQRDKDESVQFANKQLLNDVVSIIDDFERAIRSSEANQDFQSLYDGISLIEKQFIGMLERKWGIKRFDAIGETFDPQRHEAVSAEPRPDLAEQSILEVYQKGYLLHEKVLRSAKVKVSLPG